MRTLGVGLVVPSYRRPDRLARCLTAIAALEPGPSEVLVVHRTGDTATAEIARTHAARTVTVKAGGVLAAMSAGTRATPAPLVGFLDDDAEPAPDWLGRLAAQFESPGVGGACGRDRVTLEPPRVTYDVGRISAWGKLVGDHHRGAGGPRDVDVLKAANCLFRREALVLPARLRGSGAEAHFEVMSGLAAQAAGWRLRYDPGAEVEHLPGPRFDGDARGRPDAAAVRDAAYNLVVGLLSLRPELTWRRAAFGLLVGDRMTPGLLRALHGLVRGDADVAARLGPSLLGQLEGLADSRLGRGPALIGFTAASDR